MVVKAQRLLCLQATCGVEHHSRAVYFISLGSGL